MPALTDLVDLAAERLGGAVVAANDEFFAPKESLLKGTTPVFVADRYTGRGKWMDGWETRRRREPGHDWCIVRLGLPGAIQGCVVDTTHFRGNFPESCSIDAADVAGHPTPAELCAATAGWQEIASRTTLRADSPNELRVESLRRVTHLRLNIFPDGGVARLRVYGTVMPDWRRLALRGEIDLAAIEHGGVVIAASDMFFGSRHNLILPGPVHGMQDGWETRRRRGPGHDWAIVRLGARGVVRRIEVDTSHFLGNAPGSCSVDLVDEREVRAGSFELPVGEWQPLLGDTPLRPNTRHVFELDPGRQASGTSVRLNIFPDGGVARLRVYGAPVRD